MASAAAALPGAKTPARLDYANGELRLGGLDLAPDEFTSLRQRLGAAGIAARQDQGALQLRAGGQP
jgi:general secretion pathway protein L